MAACTVLSSLHFKSCDIECALHFGRTAVRSSYRAWRKAVQHSQETEPFPCLVLSLGGVERGCGAQRFCYSPEENFSNS